ncbi:MAG: response regulator transcription factor [Patescibacteria group bacterium]
MRVFIAEDQEKLAKSIKRGLEHYGMSVDYLCDGDEAAKHLILHHASYDAIILDLMLPNRSGFDICRALRERGIKTPILVLTAKSATADKIVLLNAGADDYLVKPFSFDELKARLEALMRRPADALPPELVVGVMRLDVGGHRFFCEEKEVKLTAKEFALIEFFMRHPSQILDRERILDHVWDFNFNSFSNVVDVHVKNLRKKLGQTDKRVFIETVEGVGYRLVS